MKKLLSVSLSFALAMPLLVEASAAQEVTVDNFAHAESTRFFTRTVARGGFGKFVHNPELVPVTSQFIVRPNRDTLYSSAVFDLDAGPVSISLPDAGKRYFSLIAISEEQYTPGVSYGAGTYRFDRQQIGTRYVLIGVRTLVDPNDASDLQAAHALQQQIKVSQPGGPGSFEQPAWDPASQDKVRSALLGLAETVGDSRGMFGTPGNVDPVRHLIGSASAWGGNPERDALYLNRTPSQNDGNQVYRLKIGQVPVDAFWSVSVYNAAGYFQTNPLSAYTLNSLTAKRGADGSVEVRFGGCDAEQANCLPIMPGWNYMVRLYQPQAAILDGSWKFPEATPLR
ncbi:MAG: carboxylesterase [Pseudomonas sp.]|uniref:DUF1254 domain-containing protein n=1 Tax=Pseudomonas sp. TaxID=306 RepID=UPI000CBE683D|nr:DUF1254 domain-containing protein [Pseudomonas sp.]PJI47308.1 MAG: carboxylesterase [Pseudomonas sp.]